MTDFNTLSTEQLETIAEAGREVVKWQRVLAKTGNNVVSEVIPKDGTFYQFNHCPPGDIYDRETHAQYYYHSHRPGEHGHFHTFLREKGIPKDCHPVEQSEADYIKQRNDTYSHLVAISMNRQGFPIGMFTTNRWVTAENWYAADDVCAMVDRFEIDHAQPSWPVNRWITAMYRLFRPQIVQLLRERDAVVADWQEKHPDGDVFEDRDLDLPSRIGISVDQQISDVQAALSVYGV